MTSHRYPELRIAKFTVISQYIDTNIHESRTVQPAAEGERHDCEIVCSSLHLFGGTKRLTIDVIAIRNDGEEIHGDRVQIDVPPG